MSVTATPSSGASRPTPASQKRSGRSISPERASVTTSTRMIATSAVIQVTATVGTRQTSSFPARNSRSVIGVARIGSRVRCCFSPTIENAAAVDAIAMGIRR